MTGKNQQTFTHQISGVPLSHTLRDCDSCFEAGSCQCKEGSCDQNDGFLLLQNRGQQEHKISKHDLLHWLPIFILTLFTVNTCMLLIHTLIFLLPSLIPLTNNPFWSQPPSFLLSHPRAHNPLSSQGASNCADPAHAHPPHCSFSLSLNSFNMLVLLNHKI